MPESTARWLALGPARRPRRRLRRLARLSATAGSRRPSTPSPTSSTRSRSWPGSAGRRSSSWSAGTWRSARRCSCSGLTARTLARAGTRGPGWRSSASATRSARRSGSAAATCRWSRAIAATTSRWPPRSSGARGRSSTTSRASSATTRAIREGRGRARRLGHAARRLRAGRWPSGSPGSSPGRSLEATVRRRQGVQLRPQPAGPARALRLRPPAVRRRGRPLGRWPCWPSCRSMRSTPGSCSARAWSR